VASWQVATVVELRDETPTARSLVLEIPGWRGHQAGQHVDVRLTAPDGYQAVRSYSIASVPAGERVELTVEVAPDGEVSPYLAQVAAVGDKFEVRGPVGGWFVWRPQQTEPVQLVAESSGVVPLTAMVRRHVASTNTAPLRMLYSARRPEAVIYRDELDAADCALQLTYAYSRVTPPGWPRRAGRIDAALLAEVAFSTKPVGPHT